MIVLFCSALAHHGFFAPLGDNRQLHLAALHIEHRVRRIALRKHRLFHRIVPARLPRRELRQQQAGIERRSFRAIMLHPFRRMGAGRTIPLTSFPFASTLFLLFDHRPFNRQGTLLSDATCARYPSPRDSTLFIEAQTNLEPMSTTAQTPLSQAAKVELPRHDAKRGSPCFGQFS
jgi:hypothetical protein